MTQQSNSISFCPQLAQTIGLEEAILLAQLETFMRYRQVTPHKGRNWLEINQDCLESVLPFWQAKDLQRICKNLADHKLITMSSEPLTHSGKLQYTINSVDNQSNSAAIRLPIVNTATQSTEGSSSGQAKGSANRIAPNWRPDQDVLKHIAQHNISESFALEQLGEFVTYWRDRDQIAHSWGAKFIKHVLQAWREQESNQARRKRLQQDRQERSESMPDHWTPRADIIAQLATDGIPQSFIGQCQSRFILYQQKQGRQSDNWDMAFYSWVKDDWQKRDTPYLAPKQNAPMSANWQPEEHTIQLLAGLGIPRSFVQQCLAEFIHTWIEKGAVHTSWGDVFARYVSEQWRIHQAGGKRNATPELLPENWQPSEDCLSFLLTHLGLSNEYILQQVPEFVLYWRSRGEVRHSWDKQFVNHVKYTLNHSQQQGQSGAGQQNAHQSSSTRDRSLEEQLNDHSWAT